MFSRSIIMSIAALLVVNTTGVALGVRGAVLTSGRFSRAKACPLRFSTRRSYEWCYLLFGFFMVFPLFSPLDAITAFYGMVYFEVVGDTPVSGTRSDELRYLLS